MIGNKLVNIFQVGTKDVCLNGFHFLKNLFKLLHGLINKMNF